MFNKKICTTLLVVMAIALLVVLGLRVRVGATADSIAVLKTTGMTCGSCSSKISTALEREKGVAVTEVDVDGGWVVVGYDSKSTQPENLAQKVKESGFGSAVYRVLTPEEFKQLAGREIGKSATTNNGCGGCGPKGCGSAQQN